MADEDDASTVVVVREVVAPRREDVGGINVLSITVHADPGPRADDLRGFGLTPQWGLHRIDASVAQVDLVEIARAEATAYTG